MNLVCENLPCLAPAGNSQPDSELILWIISVTIWIVLLSFSIILVNKAKGDLRDWILAFPFFSGFIGIGTMGLSVILAIFFVPSGEVGRWTENFHEQYASLSVLAYYKPMRFLIPVGFTIVSFGILISLVEGLRKWWIHSRKTGFIQSFLLVSWSITVLLGIFFVESALLFTRDIDREIHLNMVAASHICLTLSPFLCSTFLLLQTKSENKSSDFQTRLLTISVGIIIIALFTYLIHIQEILSIGFMSFSHQIMIGSQLVWLIYFSTIFFE